VIFLPAIFLLSRPKQKNGGQKNHPYFFSRDDRFQSQIPFTKVEAGAVTSASMEVLMRGKRLIWAMTLLLIARLPLGAQSQPQGEVGEARDDFLMTRRDSYLVSRQKVPINKGGKPASASGQSRQPPAAKAAPVPIGLGYTLFKKSASGEPVRVNAAQEFREGDGVRFMIESNTTGYVYIFHTENDDPPKMIFPDPQLNEGDNRIKAHVPYETPSREEPGDWWFFFDQQAATERFYIVVTRRPLAEAKAGEALVAHCEENPKNCPWRPSINFWNGLLARAGVARVSQSRESGAAQTEIEREAVTRGVELRPGAPAPSVVKMNVSPKAGMLVAQISLVHK
jgi:hypothetical protein